MSTSVNYREFVRHPGKYIGPGEVVKLSDRDYSVICKVNQVQGQVSDADFTGVSHISPLSPSPGEVEAEQPAPMIDFEDKAYRMGHYNCGCEKAGGKTLCPEHGRY